jgi:hypothetical protein
MPTSFEADQLPVVTIRAIGESTNKDIVDRLAWLTKFLDDEQRFVLVFDVTRSDAISSAQRKQWSDWLRTNDARLHRYCLGCAVVVRSSIIRGLFTAIFWISPAPVQIVFFETLSESYRWATERSRASAA